MEETSSSSNNPAHSRINTCSGQNTPISSLDEDDVILEDGMAAELKKEGTRLFQRRDYEGAAFNFDKAIKLLPKEHDDIAFLHCNIAACYMHMNPEEYQHAIDECNLALEASPEYTKALLKRARCFEALDRLDLACRDVKKVLSLEPNNVTALELFESIKEDMKEIELLKQVRSPKDPKTLLAKEKFMNILAKDKFKRKVSRQFRNSIVKEEVWLIHDDEMQENNEDSADDNCNGDDTPLKENHDQGPDQLQYALWEMEEMHLKQIHGQNKHEKPLKEIHVRISQHDQGRHTKQNQFGNTEDTPSTSRSKHEKQYSSGKQQRNSLERQMSYGEDKLEKRTTIKSASHGRDKASKHSEDNLIKFKFVLGDDVRIVLVPENCSLMQLTEIARYKYSPHLKSIHLKFKDKQGDLVTITSTEELRWIEDLNPHTPPRLFIKEVSPEREITRDIIVPSTPSAIVERNSQINSESGSSRHANSNVDDWMVQFARLFKNHAGFDCDSYVDLCDLGVRLYNEAMEDTITSEEALEIFQAAEAKFQEMAAISLYNWGNVHMSRAKKRLVLSEDASKESILAEVKLAYEWACTEYVKAGKKFEDAVDVKPDFYEGLIALGHQQYEQAKLSWRYADACQVDMGTEVLELFNHAEDNIEKGMEMWEGIEHLRLKGLSKSRKEKMLVDKLGLIAYAKELTTDEEFEQSTNMRSQLNISWGTILYERSVVEFKLGLSSWEESLTEAIEKLKTGGAPIADISVMIKSHCANQNTQEGLGIKVDEIVQAWNEMYDAKKFKNGSHSFRLEPLFRREPSKLHNILEHIQYT